MSVEVLSSGTSDIKLERVAIGSLHVDREVQRQLNRQRATDIAKAFRPEAFGYITVSERDDGSRHIVDGQHRVEALRIMGRPDSETVPCQVFRGLSKSDEAALFRWRNNYNVVKVHDKFRIRVIEGDPVAVYLSKALERHGWTVLATAAKTRGCFNAVAALEWVHGGAGIRASKPHPVAVDNTIGVITGAWGHDNNGVRRELVKGIGLFLIQYGEAVDLAKIVNELSQVEGGPNAMLGKARSLNSFKGGGVASAMAEILVEMHNKKKTVHRLPEWHRRNERTGGAEDGSDGNDV